MIRPERRAGTRFVTILSATAAVAATIAIPAAASPPFRGSDSGLFVDCPLDDGFLGISAVEFDGGSFLDVFIQTEGEFVVGFLEDADVDGTSIAGTVELRDEFSGEVVGTATVDATLTPSGPAETFSDRFRDGNVLVRFEDTFTPATVSGTVVVDGVLDTTLDLGDCGGSLFEFSFFQTNPATFTTRVDGRSADCMVEAPDVFGFVSAFDGPDFGPFLDVFLDEFEGTAVAGSTEDVVFDDETLAGTVQLFDVFTGDPAGEATVDATLTSTGTFVDREQSPAFGVKVTVEEFTVEGTLTVDGDVYPLMSCFAQDAEGRIRFTDPPRRARPVANDLPGDAAPLGVPDGDSVDTTGTTEEPEAPCVATFEFEDESGDVVVVEDPLPIGHTVWYSIEGTGGPVTVDTAGSALDTIVGVYSADLEQLACVDDVFEGPDSFSLQAAVTVGTEVGETYLVQVGGFGFESGPVTITTG